MSNENDYSNLEEGHNGMIQKKAVEFCVQIVSDWVPFSLKQHRSTQGNTYAYMIQR